jgi:hypothetical protein
MATQLPPNIVKVAAIQMSCTSDVEANLKKAEDLIRKLNTHPYRHSAIPSAYSSYAAH